MRAHFAVCKAKLVCLSKAGQSCVVEKRELLEILELAESLPDDRKVDRCGRFAGLGR